MEAKKPVGKEDLAFVVPRTYGRALARVVEELGIWDTQVLRIEYLTIHLTDAIGGFFASESGQDKTRLNGLSAFCDFIDTTEFVARLATATGYLRQAQSKMSSIVALDEDPTDVQMHEIFLWAGE